jgi:hypothetical protein
MTSRALDRTQTLCTPQPKILEPGPRSQEVSNLDSHWTTTLPEDLLQELSIRLQLFYAVGVILWVINFVMDIYLAPHGDRGPYRLRRAARGRRAGGWGDAAAARGEKRGCGIPIRHGRNCWSTLSVCLAWKNCDRLMGLPMLIFGSGANLSCANMPRFPRTSCPLTCPQWLNSPSRRAMGNIVLSCRVWHLSV